MEHPAGTGTEVPGNGELIRRLLAGEQVDHTGLDYDLGSHHLGVIVTGGGAEPLLHRLAEALGDDLLLDGREETVAGWIGSGRAFDEAQLDVIAAAPPRRNGLLAIGEPASGLAGWRATHRQARRAHALAAREAMPFARYGEVALLATVAGDADLAEFLDERFIAPLLGAADRSLDLPATLRAYLRSGADISAAAEALCVSHQTVVDRMAAIEGRIGRPPCECLAELDLALRLVDRA